MLEHLGQLQMDQKKGGVEEWHAGYGREPAVLCTA